MLDLKTLGKAAHQTIPSENFGKESLKSRLFCGYQFEELDIPGDYVKVAAAYLSSSIASLVWTPAIAAPTDIPPAPEKLLSQSLFKNGLSQSANIGLGELRDNKEMRDYPLESLVYDSNIFKLVSSLRANEVVSKCHTHAPAKRVT